MNRGAARFHDRHRNPCSPFSSRMRCSSGPARDNGPCAVLDRSRSVRDDCLLGIPSDRSRRDNENPPIHIVPPCDASASPLFPELPPPQGEKRHSLRTAPPRSEIRQPLSRPYLFALAVEQLLWYLGHAAGGPMENSQPTEIDNRQHSSDDEHHVARESYPLEHRIRAPGEVLQAPRVVIAGAHRMVELQNSQRQQR